MLKHSIITISGTKGAPIEYIQLEYKLILTPSKTTIIIIIIIIITLVKIISSPIIISLIINNLLIINKYSNIMIMLSKIIKIKDISKDHRTPITSKRNNRKTIE